MIPKEILAKVKRIQITTSRKVTDVFAGRYQSVFKGSGMEFDEVREYNPGDEIRSIDWNVTARMGSPFVKKFVEERELTIMFLLDISASSIFGTKNRLKSELAAEFCAALAFSAITNNDKVGMMTFTDRVEKFIPPRKGSKHVLTVIREALYNEPKGRSTNINNVLEYLIGVTKRRTITFLISDFMSNDFDTMLRIANKRHDIIAVKIIDPAEKSLPKAGIVNVYDPETLTETVVDTSSKKIRRKYETIMNDISLKLEETFKSAGIDTIEVSTDASYIDPLIKFFRTREQRMRRKR